jgi:hypothetical protein
VHRMGYRRSRPQRSGDHRDLDQFGVGCTCFACVAAVNVDAVRTLRSESNRDSISSMNLTGIVAAATAAFSKFHKAFMTDGAKSSNFFSLVRLSGTSLFSVGKRPRDLTVFHPEGMSGLPVVSPTPWAQPTGYKLRSRWLHRILTG